jgi:predicted ATPase
MKLEAIHIQGYKSLADLKLLPENFTVLVGPKGSGKSNVLAALDFIADIYRSGVKFAIDRRGGFANLSFRESGTPRHTMSFEVVISATAGEIWDVPPTFLLPDGEEFGASFFATEMRFRHRFSLRGEGERLISNFDIGDETIEITRLGLRPDVVFKGGRDGFRLKTEVGADASWSWLGMSYFRSGGDPENFFSRTIETGLRPTELFIDRLRVLSPVVRAFAEYLKKFRSFHLVPTVCRAAAAPTPVADLGVSGENLPAVVYHLKDEIESPWQRSLDPSGSPWSRVLDRMTLMLPDLEDIEVVPTIDRLWSLEFLESGGSRWTAEEVSDGTIRALALFSSVYDPRNALFAFEEPENALHPWILRVFGEACREQSTPPHRKQIILTTHSPALVDSLLPSEIAVVWREEGRTQVIPLLELEPDIASPWEDGSIKLSSFLDSGLLRQAVPHR